MLIDEIDKAEPDVPNNLLVELGSLQFDVDLIGQPIEFRGKRDDWQARPLVMITTNKERPLPQPFVRRCIVLEIPKPKRKLLKTIARHNVPDQDEAFFDIVLDAVLASRGSSTPPVHHAQPNDSLKTPDQNQSANRDDDIVDISIAEYVDTLRACSALAGTSDKLSQSLLQDIVTRTTWVIKERSLRPQ